MLFWTQEGRKLLEQHEEFSTHNGIFVLKR